MTGGRAAPEAMDSIAAAAKMLQLPIFGFAGTKNATRAFAGSSLCTCPAQVRHRVLNRGVQRAG